MLLSEFLEGAKAMNFGVDVWTWNDALEKHIWIFNAQQQNELPPESYIALALIAPTCSGARTLDSITFTNSEIASVTDLEAFFTSVLLENMFVD